MELSFAEQSTAFLCAVVPGVILGVLYGVVRLLRVLFDFSNAVTFISDVLFMLAASVLTFLYSLAFLSGYVRLYFLPAILFGFLLYRLTLGKLLCRMYTPVIRVLKKYGGAILKNFREIVKKVLKKGYCLLYNTKAGKKMKKKC